MSHTLLLTLALALTASPSPDNGGEDDGHTLSHYLSTAGDHAALYQGRIETPWPARAWNATPYWHEQESVTGDLCFEHITYHNVTLRHDIFHHRLVVHTPVRGLPVIPDQSKVQWFVVDGQKFVPVNTDSPAQPHTTFARLDYEGRCVSLALQRRKEQTGDQIVGRHTVHALYETSDHLLLHPCADGGWKGERITSLRQLMALYPEHRAELRQYARQQHLRGNREHLGASLAALTQRLDQLLSQCPPSVPSKGEDRFDGEVPPPLVGLRGALDSIALADDWARPLTLRSYEAYSEGGTAVYDTAEEYQAPELVSEMLPIREDRIIDEIVVRGFQSKVAATQVGMEKFRPAQLRNVPLALGEADVIKMVQTLPGVKTMGEASSGFNVRGGASDQNLIRLNGNTIYNPMHLFGIFSAFSSEVIGETELYKSSIPTQYGGRISSVMDIHSRVADRNACHGSASIGLLTSQACLELPVVQGRSSLLVGGRTTYSNWMLKYIPESSDYHNGRAGFWDASATLANTLSPNHYLNVYAYASHDQFSFTEYDRYGYNNVNASAEWRGRYAHGLTSSLSIGVDHYDYSNEEHEVEHTAARLSFAIDQYFVRGHLALHTDHHHIHLGLQSQFYDIQPGRYNPLGEQSNIEFRDLGHDRALESTLWAENEQQATDQLRLTYGARATMLNAMREGKEHTYLVPEVRLSASYSLSEDQSVKAGFNTMSQMIHKVSNTSIMSPTDTWTLSNAYIRPQYGWQAAVGYVRRSSDGLYELSAEAYIKRMEHYLTYRSAGQLLMNPDLEHDVIETRGRAHGIELMLRRVAGRLNGWISYCYARTELQQPEQLINDGRWFATEYDRPHELKLVANYKLTQRYSVSVNGDYSTGRPTTLPAGQYYNASQDRLLPFYTERNGYRLPDYVRMDASFNIEPSHHVTALTHSWFSVGCYNALGRRNAYSIYYLAENGTIRGYRLSIYGSPIPFVSWNLKF